MTVQNTDIIYIAICSPCKVGMLNKLANESTFTAVQVHKTKCNFKYTPRDLFLFQFGWWGRSQGIKVFITITAMTQPVYIDPLHLNLNKQQITVVQLCIFLQLELED